jgi:hypothetical protein
MVSHRTSRDPKTGPGDPSAATAKRKTTHEREACRQALQDVLTAKRDFESDGLPWPVAVCWHNLERSFSKYGVYPENIGVFLSVWKKVVGFRIQFMNGNAWTQCSAICSIRSFVFDRPLESKRKRILTPKQIRSIIRRQQIALKVPRGVPPDNSNPNQ